MLPPLIKGDFNCPPSGRLLLVSIGSLIAPAGERNTLPIFGGAGGYDGFQGTDVRLTGGEGADVLLSGDEGARIAPRLAVVGVLGNIEREMLEP